MAATEEIEKEILAEMAANPVPYAAGQVNDVITIDGETRMISVPASEIFFGVESDKDVERKHFRCPKVVGDGIDLSKHQIYISYITSDSAGKTFSGNAGLYLCEDVATDGDDITFSWQLSGNVFASAGFIAFKVLAAKTDGENVQTRWNTVPAIGTVLMTVPDGMDIGESYPDIVTQLLERMASVEKIATEEAMQGYVNTYLEAHPGEIDETLTDPKKAAPASVVGELKDDISNISGRLETGGIVYDVLRKNVNGAGLYDSTITVASDYIPVKKGDVISVKTSDKRNCIFGWENEVSASNVFISQSWKTTNQSYEVPKNGFVVVCFGKTDDSTFELSEYDGEIKKIDTFYKDVKKDMENLKSEADVKFDELVSEVNATVSRKDEFVSLTFESGGLNTNTGQEMGATNRARSKMFYLSRSMRCASTDDEYLFRCLKYSADGKSYIGVLNTSNQSEFQLDGGYSYRLLIFPATVSDLTNHISNITSNIVVMIKKSTYVVAKDGTGDFTDIQHCLDFIPKYEEMTVIVKSGVYDKICTLTQKKYVDITSANGNNKWYNRKLNIIGVSQKDCIIQSKTGEYYTPAAEICITGEVRNITFISDHTEPPENRSEDTNYLRHKAYAVHSDSGTEDVLYNNCRMVSYQAPAIGIGGAQDKKVRIRNCHLESYAPKEGEYSPLVNYGGLFYHLFAGDGATGQLLELEDNYIYSENGSVAVWITPSTATNYEQETHLRRNCFYGATCGKNVDINASMLHADCFGNNVESVNK